MKNTSNLVFTILFLVVLGCSCPNKLKELSDQGKSSTPEPTVNRRSPTPSTTGDYALSMEKYNRIKIGMARLDVENTLGGKGTEISSSTGGGMNFSVNKWEGEKFQSIILSFKDEKVISKSQAGLR